MTHLVGGGCEGRRPALRAQEPTRYIESSLHIAVDSDQTIEIWLVRPDGIGELYTLLFTSTNLAIVVAWVEENDVAATVVLFLPVHVAGGESGGRMS